MLDSNQPPVPRRDPWNKGRLIGQKRPLKPKDVWSIRGRLQVERRARNLALFNLAIDSKLRGCDLVRLQVDLPPKKWTGLGRHTLSERWADVAQGRMQAAGIVEALDILEEVSAGLGAGDGEGTGAASSGAAPAPSPGLPAAPPIVSTPSRSARAP
jgi:hypothetical protein